VHHRGMKTSLRQAFESGRARQGHRHGAYPSLPQSPLQQDEPWLAPAHDNARDCAAEGCDPTPVHHPVGRVPAFGPDPDRSSDHLIADPADSDHGTVLGRGTARNVDRTGKPAKERFDREAQGIGQSQGRIDPGLVATRLDRPNELPAHAGSCGQI
jgi:hypothetical protein